MQSVPDSFYALIFFGAFMLMITERCWHLQILLVMNNVPSRQVSQSDRYGYAMLGLVSSAAILGLVFFNFSFKEVRQGLDDMTEASQIIGIGMWAVLVVHAITIVAMILFMIWHLTHPPKKE